MQRRSSRPYAFTPLVLAFAYAVCALSGWTSLASADTVTLGPSPLPFNTGIAEGCAFEHADCVHMNSMLPTGVLAQAPSDGTITTWRVEDFDGTARLLVLSADSGGKFSIVGRSAQEFKACVTSGNICGPASGQVYTFTTNLPIAAGQYIGIELISPSNCNQSPDDSTCAFIGYWDGTSQTPYPSTNQYFDPTPADNTATAPNQSGAGAFLVNADEQTSGNGTGNGNGNGSNGGGNGSNTSGGSNNASGSNGANSTSANSPGGLGPAFGRFPTSTQVRCDFIVATGQDTCSATVGGGPTVPTGQVTFTPQNGGLFTLGNSCTLTGGACSVQGFIPPAGITIFPLVSAAYSGDATHLPSSATTKLLPAVEGAVNGVCDEFDQMSPDPGQVLQQGGLSLPVNFPVPGKLKLAESGSLATGGAVRFRRPPPTGSIAQAAASFSCVAQSGSLPTGGAASVRAGGISTSGVAPATQAVLAHPSAHTSVVVARLRKRVAAGPVTLHVRLTQAGKKLFRRAKRRHQRVHLTMTLKFTPGA